MRVGSGLDLLERGHFLSAHRHGARHVQRIQSGPPTGDARLIGRGQPRLPAGLAVHPDESDSALRRFGKSRRTRFVQIPADAGVDEPGVFHQPRRFEQSLDAGIEQMIAGAIHQREPHRLQVGGHFFCADHAAAKRTAEFVLVADQRFEVSEADVGVVEELERALNAWIGGFRGGTNDDHVADARERERVGDLHRHVTGPVVRRRAVRATQSARTALPDQARSHKPRSSQRAAAIEKRRHVVS